MVQLNERENQVAEAEMYELKQARYIVVNGIFQKTFFFKNQLFLSCADQYQEYIHPINHNLASLAVNMYEKRVKRHNMSWECNLLHV